VRGPLSVILNLSSGNAEDRKTIESVSEAFRAAGAEADVQRAASGEKVIELAQRAASGMDSDVVVVGGGDGTLSSAASVLAGGPKALGVLPLGTWNHFAKDLGIPLDLTEAARNVLTGRVALVDVGEVNGKIFLNNSSLGLYPRIVRHREEQRQRLGWGKFPALVWATAHSLHRHRPLEVVLTLDGHEIRRRTPYVFVGNNAYDMEGFDIGTRHHLDRSELSVYLAHSAKPLDLVLLGLRALIGRARKSPMFESLTTRALRIETRRERVTVATDGELTTFETPLLFRVRPKALRVIVPTDRNRESRR
jgi:diacylglycerol kinase family enzyme